MKWTIQIGKSIYKQNNHSIANFCEIPEYINMEYRKNTNNYPYGVMLHKFTDNIDRLSLEFDDGEVIDTYPNSKEIVCCETGHFCGSVLEKRYVVGTIDETLVINKE